MTGTGPSLRSARGVIVVWFALFLLFMLGFVALGIDVAKLMATRTQLQNAADAAALAGASAIDAEAGVLDYDLAIARAQLTSAQNEAFITGPRPVALAASDVTFPGQNRVRVVVRREGAESMVTHVAQVLGIPALAMTATATAQAETARVVDCGLVPVGLTPPTGQSSFKVGCGNTYRLLNPNAGGGQGNFGGVILPWCKHGECRDSDPYTLEGFRCEMVNGYCCSVTSSNVLPTFRPPGLTLAISQGLDARFRADTDQRENVCYSDYHGNGKRIIYAPITSSPRGGAASVSVTGFAAFFVQARLRTSTGTALIGEFVHGVVPGSAGKGPMVTGPVTYSVRLVE